jgi:hypothetical protein
MQAADVVICEHETEVRALDISQSGTFVASCSCSGQIFIHEMLSQKAHATIQVRRAWHAEWLEKYASKICLHMFCYLFCYSI